MVKNFIFIEDGSVDTENLRKIMDNSGNTDVKFITYKQGAAKPELVSIECSEATQNPEVYKQEAREELLKALYEFINKETLHVREYSYVQMKDIVKILYHGTTDDFIKQFEEHLNKG